MMGQVLIYTSSILGVSPNHDDVIGRCEVFYEASTLRTNVSAKRAREGEGSDKSEIANNDKMTLLPFRILNKSTVGYPPNCISSLSFFSRYRMALIVTVMVLTVPELLLVQCTEWLKTPTYTVYA